MKEFLLVFRRDASTEDERLSPEQLQAMMKPWQDWMGSIAAQNKLTDAGNRLEPTGKVVRSNNIITDGPYTEIKETIGGYIAVKAASLEEAVELAKDCPILASGGNVEIREISAM